MELTAVWPCALSWAMPSDPLLLREPRLPQASRVTTGQPALLLLTALGRHKVTQSELVLQFYVTVKAPWASRKDEVFILPLTPQTA